MIRIAFSLVILIFASIQLTACSSCNGDSKMETSKEMAEPVAVTLDTKPESERIKNMIAPATREMTALKKLPKIKAKDRPPYSMDAMARFLPAPLEGWTRGEVSGYDVKSIEDTNVSMARRTDTRENQSLAITFTDLRVNIKARMNLRKKLKDWRDNKKVKKSEISLKPYTLLEFYDPASKHSYAIMTINKRVVLEAEGTNQESAANASDMIQAINVSAMIAHLKKTQGQAQAAEKH